MNYVHGGDIYRHQVEYDFSVNINPFGMPEGSKIAAQKGILLADRYPDYCGEKLCLAIAGAEGIEKEQIILGNGAAELIYALCHALKPQKGIVLAPSFQEYESALLAAGGKTIFWNLEEEKNFCLGEDFLSIINEETDILFLCNPNNPTGNLTDGNLLEKIAIKCENTKTYLCLDECFLPFLENERAFTMKHWLEDFKYLVILRAFTKIYGMPGLRLGYALSASQELRDKVRLSIQPWNTSIPAQMAGIEALKDKKYLKQTKILLKQEKEYLMGELSAGLADKIYDSRANYLFFKSREDLQEILLEKKVLIRSCSNYRNLGKGFFRIGIRTHEENRELIRRWRAQEKMMCTDRYRNGE